MTIRGTMRKGEGFTERLGWLTDYAECYRKKGEKYAVKVSMKFVMRYHWAHEHDEDKVIESLTVYEDKDIVADGAYRTDYEMIVKEIQSGAAFAMPDPPSKREFTDLCHAFGTFYLMDGKEYRKLVALLYERS